LVNNYVGLLQTRFGSELTFSIQISPDQNELFLPPGAVQLLVENAIKHNGFTEKSPLIIEIYSDGKKLIVSNNLQERKGQVDSVGKGLHNIQSRYEHLSKENVIIQKTADTFKVTLPLLQKENYDNTDH
jgi:LytS/YehU family sensor histidine kinase